MPQAQVGVGHPETFLPPCLMVVWVKGGQSETHQLCGLPAAGATTMWRHVVDNGREREPEQFEHYEERSKWRLRGWREIDCCEQPALPPEPIVKSQPMLPLSVLSGSIALKQQGSVVMSITHIISKEHANIPVLGSCLGPCRSPNSVQSWPSSSLVAAFQRAGPIDHCLHLA